jgi:hypothetical protein
MADGPANSPLILVQEVDHDATVDSHRFAGAYLF